MVLRKHSPCFTTRKGDIHMFCRNCGKDISDATNFCYHCGFQLTPSPAPAPAEAVEPAGDETTVCTETVSVPEAPIEAPAAAPVYESEPVAVPVCESEPAAAPAAPVQIPQPVPVPPVTEAPKKVTPEKQPKVKAARKARHCKFCGGIIDPAAKRCSVCAKRAGGAGAAVAIILLVLLVALSAALNVLQYLRHGEELDKTKDKIISLQTAATQMEEDAKAAETQIKTQEEKISSLESTINSQNSTINIQNSEIANLEAENASLQSTAEAFGLLSSHFGYGADHFRTSEGVVVVSLNDYSRLTLTAYWDNGGTVSVDYSSSAAELEFDESTWSTAVAMTVVPYQKGVTVVTFTNNADNYSFDLLIIVTD